MTQNISLCRHCKGCDKLADVFILFEDVDTQQIEFVDTKVLHIPSCDGDEAYHVNFDKVLYVNYTESEDE